MIGRDEHGFTLAELLISTVILAIIFGVIAEAMMVGLKTTDKTDQRVRESVDAQITSVYFARDVQAAKTVYLGDASPSCGGASSTISFSWADPASGAAKRVSYVLTTNGDEQLLTRWACQTGQSSSQKAVGRFVSSITGITCDGVPCSAVAGGVVSPTPQTVTVTLNESTGTFAPALTGTRRSA